jgi:hypothetical protein
VYKDAGTKLSEHQRRITSDLIEIIVTGMKTPLPKYMSAFWTSPYNKYNLQNFYFEEADERLFLHIKHCPMNSRVHPVVLASSYKDVIICDCITMLKSSRIKALLSYGFCVRKETQHNLFQFTCYLNTYVLQ